MQDSSLIAIVLVLGAAAIIGFLAFLAVFSFGAGVIFLRSRKAVVPDSAIPESGPRPRSVPPAAIASKVPSLVPISVPTTTAGPPSAPPPPVPGTLGATVTPTIPPKKGALLGFFDEPPDAPPHRAVESTKTELFQRGQMTPSWLDSEDGEDEADATEIFSAHHLDPDEDYGAMEEDSTHSKKRK